MLCKNSLLISSCCACFIFRLIVSHAYLLAKSLMYTTTGHRSYWPLFFNTEYKAMNHYHRHACDSNDDKKQYSQILLSAGGPIQSVTVHISKELLNKPWQQLSYGPTSWILFSIDNRGSFVNLSCTPRYIDIFGLLSSPVLYDSVLNGSRDTLTTQVLWSFAHKSENDSVDKISALQYSNRPYR